MSATITLTVIESPSPGDQLTVTDRNTIIIGRADECAIRFPNDRDHQKISRHHCLLEINPPAASIRDLGSRKGTYVNGELIGRRSKSETAEDAPCLDLGEFILTDGDKISLGVVTIQLRVFESTQCIECGNEIPDLEKPHCLTAEGEFCCEPCRNKLALPPTVEYVPGECRCVQCGKNASGEKGSRDYGVFVCAQCKSDPRKLADKLLEIASSEPQQFASIQGYRIDKELGSGGMGAVYLAVHEKSGKQVALKLMLPEVATTQHHRDLFLREVANTKVLDHRNVVRLFDYGVSQGTFFFTLEYCQGGSLFGLLKRQRKPLPIEKAVRLACSILDGLAYAHSLDLPPVRLADGRMAEARGLVHRDIKPQNIFFAKGDKKFIAKIGDYGLSKAFELAGLSGISTAGQAAGTPHFMPRQQLLNYRDSKPEVDIWATAATLYFALTLSTPRTFPRGQDPWRILLDSKPVPIRQRDSSIPQQLADVIDRALVDESQMAFQTATALRDELGKVL